MHLQNIILTTMKNHITHINTMNYTKEISNPISTFIKSQIQGFVSQETHYKKIVLLLTILQCIAIFYFDFSISRGH